jgi:hypothetical protein
MCEQRDFVQIKCVLYWWSLGVGVSPRVCFVSLAGQKWIFNSNANCPRSKLLVCFFEFPGCIKRRQLCLYWGCCCSNIATIGPRAAGRAGTNLPVLPLWHRVTATSSVPSHSSFTQCPGILHVRSPVFRVRVCPCDLDGKKYTKLKMNVSIAGRPERNVVTLSTQNNKPL